MGDRLGIHNVLDKFYLFSKRSGVEMRFRMGDRLRLYTNMFNTSFPIYYQGIARTQSPTNKNYALELPTFGAIVGVSQTEVQWNGLALEEPPS